MTVAINDRRREHPGNGVATVFNGPMAYQASHINGYLVDDVTGVSTPIPGASLNVTLLGREGGTNVEVLSGAPPAGVTLLLLRDVPVAQVVDITNQGSFNPNVIERQADLIVMQNQQHHELLERAIRFPDTTTQVFDPVIPTPLNPLDLVQVRPDGLGFVMSPAPEIATVADGAITDEKVSPLADIQSTKLLFQQAGVGAEDQDVQYMGRRLVSVTDYMTPAERADIKLAGPLLDHTASIQKAATACALGGANGELVFPKGLFNVGAEVLAQFSGVIRGAGTQDTIIRTTSPAANLFSTVGSFGCLTVRDLQINTTVPRVGGAAFYVNTDLPLGPAQARFRMDNVAIYNQYKAVEILNAGYWIISNCWFYDCVQYGVYADCTSNFDAGDNTITGCLFTANNTTCVHVRLINNCRVQNNKMLGGAKGVYVEPSAAPGTRVDFQISWNSIENQATHGIHFRVAAAGVGIANSQIGNNQIAAFILNSQCIAINGPVGGMTISDNLCSLIGNTTTGIALVANGTGAPGTMIVADNLITGGPAGSLGIYAGGDGVVLDNNLIPSAATRYQTAHPNVTIRNTSLTFAELGAIAAGGVADGSHVYCPNGAGAFGAAVVGGGGGCFAGRLGGAWVSV